MRSTQRPVMLSWCARGGFQAAHFLQYRGRATAARPAATSHSPPRRDCCSAASRSHDSSSEAAACRASSAGQEWKLRLDVGSRRGSWLGTAQQDAHLLTRTPTLQPGWGKLAQSSGRAPWQVACPAAFSPVHPPPLHPGRGATPAARGRAAPKSTPCSSTMPSPPRRCTPGSPAPPALPLPGSGTASRAPRRCSSSRGQQRSSVHSGRGLLRTDGGVQQLAGRRPCSQNSHAPTYGQPPTKTQQLIQPQRPHFFIVE